MINKKYIKLLRSRRSFNENNFIYNIISKRIIDSLDLLKLKVDNILEVGINEDQIFNYIIKKFNKVNVKRADLYLPKHKQNDNFVFFEIFPDKLNLKDNFYDIIYSNTFLHLNNNFEKSLECVFNSLNKEGFFIAAIPDPHSMFQLSNSMYETDFILYNGVFQRFNPTIQIDNILPIFKKLNFDNPSIYSDNISIEYSNFEKLLNDVRNMNLSYCYKDKKRNFEKKKYFKILEEIYRKKYYDENYILNIKINIISAWKK